MSPAMTGRWGASCRPFPQGQVLRAGEERGEMKGGFTRGSNFVRHVGKELGFRPVGKFGSFPSSRISLDRVPQVKDHLIDLALQFVHFS